MKKLLLLSLTLFLLSGCKQREVEPKIIVKINNEVFDGETIPVKLNSYHEIRVESTGHYAKFYKQINAETPVNIWNTDGFQILAEKHDDYGNKTLVAEIFTTFPDSVFAGGDVVRIKLLAQELVRSIYYSIEE